MSHPHIASRVQCYRGGTHTRCTCVGSGAGQVKIGSLAGWVRGSKYNRLLRINRQSRLPWGKEHHFQGGSNASFPSFWLQPDRERRDAITLPVRRGLQWRLPLSHVACFKVALMLWSGFRYGHILKTFLHNLEEVAVPDTVTLGSLKDNPQRLFSRLSGAV